MLERSPVFLGLSRPPKYLGLPVDYLAVLMMATLLPYVVLDSLRVLAMGALAYPILWVLADRELRFFEVLQVSCGSVRGMRHAA